MSRSVSSAGGEPLSPEVAALWVRGPDGEEQLTPDQVTTRSCKRPYWMCSSCGDIRAVRVADLVRGTGLCRPCSLKQAAQARALPGPGESLPEGDPELAGQWLRGPDGEEDLRADQVTLRSTKEPYWRCAVCGHVWTAMVSTRARGIGCKPCGIARSSGEN